ncbi:MAG: glutamine--tRNA ligase/YqeY domain fusion protein [Polyangiaceae bacterium]
MTTSNEAATPPRAEPEAGAATNFLREIVQRDVAAGKHGGRVVTRFPPEPNGYPHIGHAKSICLNFGLAREMGGVCHLRMDDTNPETEEMEYVEAIQRDIRWLGFDWGDKMFFASDYYERLYEYAEQLIRQGDAYVCSLSEDDFRTKYRGTVTEPGKPSPYRDRTVDENLDLFRRMRAGEFPDGAHVLRAKIDMASPNMKMRDWPLVRIRHASHYRKGDAWCIYPLYDFAHCLSDLIEGITHSVCTLEFENNRELYDWIIERVGAKDPDNRPHQYEFARLNLSYTMMSKRKLLHLVETKTVSGWDDPRMPTLSGMRRRGYTPEAIRELCERVGVAKNNSVVDLALLEHLLRDDLDAKSPRMLAVLRPLRVVIETMPEGQTEALSAPLWPAEMNREGSRKLPFSREIYIDRDDFMESPPKDYHRLAPGREVRLRHAYVIKCERVVKDDKGEIVELICSHDPASLGEATPGGRRIKGTIQWVSAAHAATVEVRLYDRLFLSEAPGIGDDMSKELNPASLASVQAKVEPSLAAAKPGERFQLERLGFFFVDPVDSKEGAPIFNRTVSLKDSWAKATARSAEPAPAKEPKKEPAKQPAKEPEKKELSPEAKALADKHDLSPAEASLLADDAALRALFEGALAKGAAAKLAAKWVANEVRALAKEDAAAVAKLEGASLAELIAEVEAGRISATIAKEVLAESARTGATPRAIIEKKGIRQIVDTDALAEIASAVIAENADMAARFRAGNANVLGALVGAAMRKSGGKANAKALQEALRKALS